MGVKGGFHGAWAGKRPDDKRRWYSRMVDVLHAKIFIGLLCLCGWTGLILALVVVVSLKGADDYTESTCSALNLEVNAANSTVCVLSVFAYDCNTTVQLNQSTLYVPLLCGEVSNVSLGTNITCFTPNLCLEDQVAVLTNPDPAAFATPTFTDLTILLIGVALLPFGILGAYLLHRVFLLVPRERDLPF